MAEGMMGEDSDVAVAQQQQEGEGDTKDKLESPKSSVKVVASSAAEDADKGTAAATTSGAGDAWDTNGADQTAAQPVAAAGTKRRPRNVLTEEQAKRSKRLFGSVLGTLHQLKSENQSNPALQKRLLLEAKLKEKLEREKAELSSKIEREREEMTRALQEKKAALMLERRQRDTERLTAMNDSIKKHYEGCTTSIETRTQPGLFFTPRTHNNKTRDRLKETKERYEKKLQVHMDKYNVEAMMDKEYLKRDASMASLPSAGGQESSSQTKKEGDADMMTDVTEKVVEPVKAEDDPTTEQTQKDHEHAEKSASEAGNDKVEKKDDEPQKDEASPRGDDDSTTQKEEARPQEDKSEPMESSMEEE